MAVHHKWLTHRGCFTARSGAQFLLTYCPKQSVHALLIPAWQDRTAKTGLGAGLYPGQLITAPIAAYLTSMGVEARIEEYFLDNRVGLPDPRTFADPRYYCDILIEIVTCEA